MPLSVAVVCGGGHGCVTVVSSCVAAVALCPCCGVVLVVCVRRGVAGRCVVVV